MADKFVLGCGYMGAIVVGVVIFTLHAIADVIFALLGVLITLWNLLMAPLNGFIFGYNVAQHEAEHGVLAKTENN